MYREKYDVKYSDDKVRDLLRQMQEFGNKENWNNFDKIANKIPYDPDFALDIKKVKVLKALTYANLSDAKNVYPEEF